MNGVSIVRKAATGFASLVLGFFLMGSLAQAGNFTVTTLDDSGDSGSLTWAIGQANALNDADLITFDPNLAGTLTMTGDLPSIGDQVEIRGPGRDKVTIDGVDQYDLFYFNSSATVSGLTIANGGYSQGGAIYAAGALSLDSVRLTGSEGLSEGGALHIASTGSLTMTDSEVTGNSASNGGGIWSAGNVTITDSKIAGNTATSSSGGGGGLRVATGAVQISGTEISGNTASNYGGIGVSQSLDSGQVTISDSKITDNTATATGEVPGGGGGGITSGNATITDTEISGNGSASGSGGLALSGNATVTSSLIAGNMANGNSAGLTLTGGDPNNESSGNFTVTNSTITGNVSSLFGGGIVSGISQLKIEASTITGNSATSPGNSSDGGAGVTQIAGNTELVNSIVSGNSPADIAAATALPGPPPPFPLSPGTIKGAFSLVGTAAAGALAATVPGSNIASTNPKLDSLAANGGKLRTMMPADDSPAVDKGLSALTTDQRGLTRPVDIASIANAAGGNGADIGAVELQISDVDPDPPTPPSNQFTLGRYKVNKKTGVASLQVKVPGKGKLLVLGSRTVARSSKTAKRASTVKVKIKAKGKAARTLRKKGKAKVKVKVRFTPTGGTARTKAKTIKLTKKKAKSKKRR